MSRKYLPVNRDQPMMLPEDMRLWVEPDHFVWFLIDVIDGLDTTALRSLGTPGRGRPGYDPRMLAVLLIYAYLQAERSSRKIEARCRTDAAFRIATGNQVPDHPAICRFRAAAAQAGGPLEDLFTRVLFVLAVAGLGRLDVISAAGPEIQSDAPEQANRTEDGLRKLARKIATRPPAPTARTAPATGTSTARRPACRPARAAAAATGGRCPGWAWTAPRCRGPGGAA